MNLEKFKDKIDNYFNKVTPEEIIERFEKYGYRFEPISESGYDIIVNSRDIKIELNQNETCFNSFNSVGKSCEQCAKIIEDINPLSGTYSNSEQSDYSLAA